MRKFAILSCALLVAAAFVPAWGQAAEKEEKTLTGEPVDIACYLEGRAGEGHAACAKACAEKGNPIGLVVDEDGKKVLYLAMGSTEHSAADMLKDHMGKQVKATGTVRDKEGLKVIAVAKVEPAK